MTQTTEPPGPTDGAELEPLEAVPVDSGPHGIALVVVSLLAVLAVVGLVWLLWQMFDGSGSSDGGSEAITKYVAGKGGERYTSRPGRFTALFPTEPTTRTTTSRDGSLHIVESKPTSHDEFRVTWERAPRGADEQPEATLEAAAGALTADSGGEMVAQNPPVTFVILVLKDFTYRKGLDYFHTRLLLTPGRFYTEQVVSRSAVDPAFGRFRNQFSTLPPKERKGS